MTREEIREDINSRPITDFYTLERSPKAGAHMYVCPICGSGTGKNKTGALSIKDNRVTCFSKGCFTDKGQDTLGALRILWGDCSETEAFERAGYEIGGEKPIYQEHKESQKQKTETSAADYTSFYRECHEALLKSPEALDYLHGRRISDDSIERFNLGYCESWKHSKSGAKVPPTKRIIIPRTAGTYTARRIDAPSNDYEANYTKQIQGKQKDLFNLEALEGADVCFIVEGELDAISLYQAGASHVVGIGSKTNTGTMLEEAKKHPETVYILALDNDKDEKTGSNPTLKKQRELEKALQEEGISVISAHSEVLYNGEKDGNDALVKYPDKLKEKIASHEKSARKIKDKQDKTRETERRAQLTTGEEMLEDFFISVSTGKAFEPIETGITDLDRALQGGFIRKTLVMLGAAPGMGKTALAQWMFENMAIAGHDVLYLNLEMSREQLIARSFSRIIWKFDKKDMDALNILRGYSWTEEQRDSIILANDYYKESIAPHFKYNPEGITNSIDSLLTAMRSETAIAKNQGKPAPLICIDYLQLIDSGERDAIEGMKNVIFKLKDFAKRENTIVFVIMANNRASNRTGTAELESGRDTSALEYSADLMLGLTYTAIEDHRKYENGEGKDGKPRFSEYDLDKIRQLKKEAYEEGKPVPSVCNELTLKVLKNRFGDSERRAHFIFDGKHSNFMQREYKINKTGVDEWTEVKGSPFLTK